MALAMDLMLDEEQAKDEAKWAEELRAKKTANCIRCGKEMINVPSNTLRCRPCAIKHTKEQVKLKKLSEALTKVND